MVGMRVNEEIRAAPSGALKSRRISNWRGFGTAGQRMGPADARVTVVEFSDFQCPYCRKAAQELKELRYQSAQAAECAARQNMFEPFHDHVFLLQDSIGKRSWLDFAADTGVRDMLAFRNCLSDPAVGLSVRADQAAGNKLGVLGTPTFLINDLEVSGYPGDGKLAEIVRSALTVKRAAWWR